MANVGHDADDRERGVDRIHARYLNRYADRIGLREISPHECLVDDRRRWLSRPVAVVQRAALQEARAKGLEIPRGRDAIPGRIRIAMVRHVRNGSRDQRPLRT